MASEGRTDELSSVLRVIGQMPGAIALFSHDEFKVKFMNDAYRTFLPQALKNRDMIGVRFADYARDGENSPIFKILRRVSETGQREEYKELKHTNKDGTTFWLEWSFIPIENGEAEADLLSMVRDITDRKRLEEALKESEQRLRTVLDNSLDGINMLDLVTGRYSVLSPAQLEMTGFTEDELNGITAEETYERTHPDDREITISQQKRVMAGEDTGEPVEYRWKVKSGEYRWFSDRRKLVRDEQGRPVALVGISRDITERKKGEEFLRESETFSSALNQINSYINSTLDYHEIMERVLREGANALGAESSLINLREGDFWVARFVHNFPSTILGQKKTDEESPTSMLVAKEGKAVAIDDAYNDPRVNRQSMKAFGVRSVLVAPILLRKEVIGVIAFYHHSKSVRFSDAQIDFANKLSGSLSQAMDNARHYEEVKNAEDQVRRHNAILEGINRIFRETIVSETDEDLGLVCLNVAEEITKSKFGFIGQLNSQGLLDDDAISNPGWKACTIAVPKGHGRLPVSMKVHGIYGRVMTDGKAFYTNDPSSHPDSIGVPEGHPPLTAFLGVPLKHAGKVIGMIGLGNKVGGYNYHDLRVVEALAPAMVEALRRKKAEEELRKSEEDTRQHLEEMETLMNTVPAAIWVAHDPECRVITGNQAGDEFYESGEDENVSAGWASGDKWDRTRRFFRDGRELRPEELPMQEAARLGVEIRNSELEVLLPSGRKMVMLGNARPLLDARGKVRGSVSSFIDITERKRIEVELERTKARLEAIINQMPVGILVADAGSGEILFANDEIYKMYGLGFKPTDIKEFVDYSKLARCHLDGRPYQTDEYPFVRSLRGEVIRNEMAEILRPDGSEVFISGSSAPVFDTHGNIVALVALSIDVTEPIKTQRERDRLLAELEEHSKKLQRSNAELQQFAYVASHDLQEPLRMVTAYLSLLEKKYGDRLEGKAREYMDYAVEGGQRARDLVRDLLEVSRVDSQAKPLSMTDLNEVMEKVCANLSIQIKEEHATVTSNPLPIVMADDAQMTILLQNLISNAIKFHGDKEPKVNVSCKNKDDQWLLSVSDNGIGIDPQFKDKIFVIFQRLHDREEYMGSGIGLAIAKKIVERHSGRIWFESEVGQGTTFYFTIPKEVKTWTETTS